MYTTLIFTAAKLFYIYLFQFWSYTKALTSQKQAIRSSMHDIWN